ncbi:hypothetical protein BKA61DRAFT_694598 [Leptodontidium sp. MPI-SDFR-AT-0119]|nr:hypothetical protein BKA61DRAFT_694598 [Leptodontidium sp. MPI-SDFR-AT-0119]
MEPAVSKEHIGFESLATEIILNVLNQLPDLPTLHSLINASPVSFRLFEDHGAEIIESVMKSGTTTKRIPEMIRLVALMPSSSLSISSLDELQERVVRQSMVQQRSHDAFLPETLSRNTQSVILRGILASATRISHLSSDCLQFYLDRLATIESEVLVDEKFSYRQGHPPHFLAIPAWKMRPEGRKSALGKLEGPSWIEVQRVERAFWRMEPKDFYNKSSYAEYEEVNTIVDYLHVLRARDANILPAMWDGYPSYHSRNPTCWIIMPDSSLTKMTMIIFKFQRRAIHIGEASLATLTLR